MLPDVLGPLEDIRDAADFIVETTATLTLAAFVEDRTRRYAVERAFEIVSEAVNRLFRHAPGVADSIAASRQIVNFRNALAHGYDTIDYETMWQVIQEFLPVTREEVDRILRDSNPENREL